MIRLALIDDDQLLADALAHWSQHRNDVNLVVHAARFADFRLRPVEVDVVLLDLRLQDGSNPAANVRTLTACGHRVLVVSTVRDQEQVVATFEAGADGYLTKDAGIDALARAAAEVAQGRPVYSRELVFSWLRDRRPGRPVLSQQEESVLLKYVSGMTLEAAARAAGIQPNTAKGYLERVKSKYRAAGRPATTKLELADRVREDGRGGAG